jgi:hypothetical protein
LLKPAVEQSLGRFTLEDVYHLVVTQESHLWVVLDEDEIIATCTTTFTQYPRKRMLTGQFLGGTRLMEWMGDLDEMLQRWGMDHGCAGIELTGRRGWVRALRDIGWNATFFITEKGYE